MEVKKQPSPWPCVVMLVALLACCLAAPHYWQRDTTSKSAEDAEFSPEYAGDCIANPMLTTRLALPNAPFDLGNVRFGITGNVPNSDLLNLWAPPTIEELIATGGAYGQSGALGNGTNGQSFDWPPFTFPTNSGSQINDSSTNAPPNQPVEPSPFVTSSLERIGTAIAEFSPADVLRPLITRLADTVPVYVSAWSTSGAVTEGRLASRSTVRVMGPEDRLAVRPAAPKASPWCVPEVLYEQLQRLADHAYSAEWASQVGNELHALTDRDQLEGDDVQTILADLSDAAEEALRMADGTDDDRLRVELLRAHWALARRLDCWAAMHEERVAYHFRGRVAARDGLSPYFNGASGDSSPPADVTALSQELEAYEKNRDPRLGRHVVEAERALAASPASFDRALADAVEQHYRNANVRVAITAQMINRMVGGERSASRPIHDRIAGAAVLGRSDVRSESQVLLDPANDEWQLKVVTKGAVESNTLADARPVRLRSRGATDFSGSKSVVVRSDGVHLQPSDIEAASRSRLVGVTTDYDWIPLFGNYARDRAVQEYQAKRNWVRSVMESRVSTEAGDVLDRDTHEAMERARQNLYARFTDRFDQYGIKLTTVEMKSTPERLVARVRVASDEQLGSHTPRPRALSDSLASVQLHESALNNLAITLGLDGQRLTAAELQQKLRERFPQMAQRDPQELRRETVFQFAPKDAVQFHIGDGRLELKVAFDSVELDGDPMPDFIVHVFYTPVVDGLDADLARDGTLGIEGRLSASERGRLHNIFKSVFPPERKLQIVHIKNDDRRFDGLMITQLVLEDGWVGAAIGPESSNRVAERSRSLR